MSNSAHKVLDQEEARLVDLSQNASKLADGELLQLVRALRERRDRVQRMIRTRTRDAHERGDNNPDLGAREKNDELSAAIERLNTEIDARKLSDDATEHLREAVERKSEHDAKNEALARKEDARAHRLEPSETPRNKPHTQRSEPHYPKFNPSQPRSH